MEFLRCDATGCDYDVKVVEITEDMIGTPCPKCGADLLSKGDYDYFVETVRPVMKFAMDLGLIKETETDGNLRINNHDGKLKIEMDVSAPTPHRNPSHE